MLQGAWGDRALGVPDTHWGWGTAEAERARVPTRSRAPARQVHTHGMVSAGNNLSPPELRPRASLPRAGDSRKRGNVAGLWPVKLKDTGHSENLKNITQRDRCPANCHVNERFPEKS